MYRMFNEKSFNENFSLREIYKNNNNKKKRKKKRKYYDFAHAINCTHEVTCMYACACTCDSTPLREQ